MSILIKGMKMPTVAVTVTIWSDGAVTHDMGNGDRQVVGRAVPVPHGDLIDRKAAYDSLLDGMVMTGYQSRALDCISDFCVPTIIKAEEANDERLY